MNFDAEKELPPSVIMRLDSLRKTPRKRPDWASMMKEIESGKSRTLRRVETNDRSKPILPKVKAKGKVLNGQTLPTWSDDPADGEMTTVVNDQFDPISSSLTIATIHTSTAALWPEFSRQFIFSSPCMTQVLIQFELISLQISLNFFFRKIQVIIWQ